MVAKSKSVIILGTGASMQYCDYRADEIWGVNGSYTIVNAMPENKKKFFRMDKLFMADTLFSHETGSMNFHIGQMNAFSEKYNCQMYSLHPMKLGKYRLNTKKIPYDKMVGYFRSDYFTDTICYMLAYLLYTHTNQAVNIAGVVRPELVVPLTIRFFGIDMSTTREYQQSKGGVEHWLGMAWALGCGFENASGSTILMHPSGVPYGRWDMLLQQAKDKALDPFGLMKGKDEPTTADADKIQAKMKAELRPSIRPEHQRL